MRVKVALVAGAQVVGVLCTIVVSLYAYDRFHVRPLKQQLRYLRYEVSQDFERLTHVELDRDSPGFVARQRQSRLFARDVSACAAAQVARIRANYEDVDDTFALCKDALERYFRGAGLQPTEPELFAIYVGVLSSNLADYGPSQASSVEAVLREKQIECAQSALFVAKTIKHFDPAAKVQQVLISNTPFGNHALVQAEIGGHTLLIDGLIGLIAFGSLDDMFAAGDWNQIPIVEFYDRTDPDLSVFSRNLTRALRLGMIQRSNIQSVTTEP